MKILLPLSVIITINMHALQSTIVHFSSTFSTVRTKITLSLKLVKNISVFPAHSDIRKVYAELERTNMKLLIANTDRIFYAS